mmetsp:Transcript_8705/g.21690  ORF Transcript_8705/g.21690 Transcript_8705/m.21690 type:complete len:371 (+) Transcript_8705:446-1558(+)
MCGGNTACCGKRQRAPRPAPLHTAPSCFALDPFSAAAEALSPNSQRSLIRAIQGEAALSPATKSRKIQRVLMARTQGNEMRAAVEKRKKLEEMEMEHTWFDKERGVMGCKHYPRSCKLKAKCCGKFVSCRLCHDEMIDDHKIDRFATEEVLCMKCGDVQPVGQNCRSCNVTFAKYFCGTCNFYDDTPDKDIYHCDGCGICRVGKGIGIDNFHCNKCNSCVTLASRSKHQCFENSLQSDCPVCSEFLFTSVLPVVFMRCGHTMHSGCFDEYTKNHNYTCPICSKSLSDMKEYYAELEALVTADREHLPQALKSTVSKILCNDCGAKTEAPFHYFYHKCSSCTGWNTRVIGQRRPEMAVEPGADPIHVESSV